MFKKMTLAFCGLYLVYGTHSIAQHSQQSTATTNLGVSESAVMYNVPNGTGTPFTAARDATGNIVDATITLTVKDNSGNVVPNFPREDIWLETTYGGLISCACGTMPDADTDANGKTVWTSPIYAGGYSEEFTQVIINGESLEIWPDLNIDHNSADINGDGVVNLSDLTLFTYSYLNEPYDFRIDFVHDQITNLSDLVAFSNALNAQPICTELVPGNLCQYD